MSDKSKVELVEDADLDNVDGGGGTFALTAASFKNGGGNYNNGARQKIGFTAVAEAKPRKTKS